MSVFVPFALAKSMPHYWCVTLSFKGFISCHFILKFAGYKIESLYVMLQLHVELQHACTTLDLGLELRTAYKGMFSLHVLKKDSLTRMILQLYILATYVKELKVM